MAQVVWAEPALEDLRQIHDYIRRDSLRYAQVTIERITAATGRLAAFPESGSILPEFPDSPYRQVFVGPYRIAYRFERSDSRVIVLAVVHGSRDFPAALPSRE